MDHGTNGQPQAPSSMLPAPQKLSHDSLIVSQLLCLVNTVRPIQIVLLLTKNILYRTSGVLHTIGALSACGKLTPFAFSEKQP